MSINWEDLWKFVGIVILAGAILWIVGSVGYFMGVSNTYQEAAKLGFGQYSVDPMKGGDVQFNWNTNRLDK